MPYLAARVPPGWDVIHFDEDAEEIASSGPYFLAAPRRHGALTDDDGVRRYEVAFKRSSG